MTDHRPGGLELPMRDLRRFKPTCREPHDFEAFWANQLAEARMTDRAPTVVQAQTPLRTIDSFSVEFPGWQSQPINAWLHLPRGLCEPLPAVVEFSGYGQGRGLVHERTLYAQAGYAHLVVDARGQSGALERCDTPDISPTPLDSASVMTRGLAGPAEFYFTRLIVDAVRAVDFVRSHAAVDPHRTAVAGSSQGGGLALAVGALVEDVAAVCADVPFLCHVWRGMALASEGPYVELHAHLSRRPELAERARTTYGYVDGMHFARHGRAPALFSVGGEDGVCPPSTTFAAFNHYQGPKDIRVYPHNGHEGGTGLQAIARLEFIDTILRG